MSNENILAEFAEVDRKLWEEAGGTVDGFFDLCHRCAQEDHAKFLAEMEREKAAGTWTRAGTPGDGAAEGTAALADGAMMVCEDAPGYGAGDRKGAEGDG
jgi:hypothetical protein